MSLDGSSSQSVSHLRPFVETNRLDSARFCWPLLLEERPHEVACHLAKDFFHAKDVSFLHKMQKRHFFSFAAKRIAVAYEGRRLPFLFENCLYKRVVETPAHLLPQLLEKTEAAVSNKLIAHAPELPERTLLTSYTQCKNAWLKEGFLIFAPKCIQVTLLVGAYILAYWLWRRNSPMPLGKALKGWLLFLSDLFH